MPRATTRIGTSLWPGYEPLFLARHAGKLDERAYRLVEYSTESENANAFLNGSVEVTCLTLNTAFRLMENGVALTVVLVMDESTGGDAVVARKGITSVSGLRGMRIGLETEAVQPYTLLRALNGVGLGLDDVRLVSIPTSQHASALAAGEVDAVATNEPVKTNLTSQGYVELFSSKHIPGEILDVMVARQEYAGRNAEWIGELRAAWYAGLEFLDRKPKVAAALIAARENLSVGDVGSVLDGVRLPDRAGQRRWLNDDSPELLRKAGGAGAMTRSSESDRPATAGFYSLRVLVPALLLLFTAGATLITYMMETVMEAPLLEERFREERLAEATQLQSIVKELCDRNDMEMLKGVIAQQIGGVTTTGAYFIDESGVIIAAGLREENGERFADVLRLQFSEHRERLSAVVDLVRRSREAAAIYLPNGTDLVVCLPSILPSKAGDRAPRRGGILLLRYDLSYRKAVLARATAFQMLVFAACLALASLVLGAVLHSLIVNRLYRLQRAMGRFAEDHQPRPVLTRGRDEIAVLYGEFNRLTEAVASTIAERREAERQLIEAGERVRDLYNNAPCGYHSLDEAGVVVHINDTELAWLGYEREEVEGRMHFSELLAEDSAANFEQVFAEFKQRHTASGVEFNLKRKDGSTMAVLVSAKAITDAQGNYLTCRATVHDISERRMLEAQLRHSQKMEAIGRLAGGVAHDFNNLLTVINGYSSLIVSSLAETDPLRRQVQEIAKAGERAKSLTQQLLAFGRKQDASPKPLNLNRLVRESLEMLERLAGVNIHFDFREEPELGLVNADPGLMHQVLLNLVVNARDAMPGGGTLTIETANGVADPNYVPPPGQYVVLIVRDTGMGMSEEIQQRVFEPFFTTKEQGRGTGLGLATVYGIVKQSGGHISLQSAEGAGTTFRIWLPRIGNGITEPEAPVPPGRQAGGDATILVAEDEEMVRALVCTVLRRSGYRVLEASDAVQALSLLESEAGPVDLLLTDVIMPGMTGKELATHVRLLRPATRVLLMSGHTAGVIQRPEVEELGHDFVAKPFTPDSLAKKVREVLGR
ncbi:MAG: response regulator [Acidobacteria bacterium]|nr:response regulator [Acidobacteriota bacterium]